MNIIGQEEEEKEICSICLDEIDMGKKVGPGKTGVKLIDCGHFFHVPCIHQWLLDHDTCPMCRASQSFRPYLKMVQVRGRTFRKLIVYEEI